MLFIKLLDNALIIVNKLRFPRNKLRNCYHSYKNLIIEKYTNRRKKMQAKSNPEIKEGVTIPHRPSIGLAGDL